MKFVVAYTIFFIIISVQATPPVDYPERVLPKDQILTRPGADLCFMTKAEAKDLTDPGLEAQDSTQALNRRICDVAQCIGRGGHCDYNTATQRCLFEYGPPPRPGARRAIRPYECRGCGCHKFVNLAIDRKVTIRHRKPRNSNRHNLQGVKQETQSQD